MRARHLSIIVWTLALLLPARSDSSSPPTQQQTLRHIDSLWTINERDAFWSLLDAELATARIQSDRPYIARLQLRRGQVQAGLGMALEAEPTLREVLSLTRELGEIDLECACLRWLGVAFERQGRPSEATVTWEQLLDRSREAENLEHEAWAWAGLAYHKQRIGHAGEARKEYMRSMELFRRLDHVWGEQFAAVGLGTALDDLGEYDEALDLYQQIAQVSGVEGMTWLEARAVNNAAVLHFMLGDPGMARDGFRRAREFHVIDGDYSEAILAGVNYAYCDAELGRHDEAVSSLEQLKAESVLHGLGDVEANVDNAIAVTRLRQGRHHAAVRLYRALFERGEDLTAQIRLEALVGLSVSLSEIDSLEAALELMRSQADWCRGLDDQQVRMMFETEFGRILFESGDPATALSVLEKAEKLAGELGQTGHQLSAIAIAARAARALGLPDRAFALLRYGTRVWEVDRGLPADPEWREIRSASARAIYSQLGSLMLDHPVDQPLEVRTQQAFDTLQVFKARTLMERMLGPGGEHVPKLAPDPVTCRELQEQVLRPKELLLDYYLGEEECILFAVSRHDCRAIHLPPRRELEALVSLYHRAVSAPPGHHPRDGESELLHESADRMSELLFGSALDLTRQSDGIVVIPDGIINLIGFLGLLEPSKKAGGDEGVRRAKTLQIAPSATIFADLRRRTDRRPEEIRPVGKILALYGARNDVGERLSGAVSEVIELRRRFRGVENDVPLDSITSGESRDSVSRVDAVLQGLERFDLLHFASHSTADDQRPWRSRIHLRTISDPLRRDLFASEIAGCRLTAELAVLSSCRSAGGRIVSGEGVQGLASALLSAGVPTVVATLWPVDDRTTSRMMGLFYEELARGQRTASALTEAQRILRSDPKRSHPFYWAGFVLIGDGESRLQLEERRRIPRYLVPAILAVVGIFGIAAPRIFKRSNGRNL